MKNDVKQNMLKQKINEIRIKYMYIYLGDTDIIKYSDISDIVYNKLRCFMLKSKNFLFQNETKGKVALIFLRETKCINLMEL